MNLLVVDFDTDKYYRSRRIIIHGSMTDIEVTETPRSNPAKSAAAANTDDENCKYIIIVIVVILIISTDSLWPLNASTRLSYYVLAMLGAAF